MREQLSRVLIAGLSFAFLSGCISKQPIQAQRYFHPRAEIDSTKRQDLEISVRLGRVHASPHLGDRMIWRLSEVEVAFDESNRWAAPPETLTRDVLSQILYSEVGFRRGLTSGVPLVDVHVVEFEGVASSDRAAVELRVTMTNPSNRTVSERVFRTDQTVNSPTDPASLARAIGIALADVARQLGDWLGTEIPPSQTEATN